MECAQLKTKEDNKSSATAEMADRGLREPKNCPWT